MNNKISVNKGSIGNGVNIDMVSSDQMSESDRRAIFERKRSVDAIPDLDILTRDVYEILEYLENSETKNTLKKNDSAVKMHLNSKYADSVPLGIITLLMDEENRIENVERLLRMFEDLKRAKLGEITLDDAEKTITDEVNQRYIYSKYGSREEFEKELAREVNNERKKEANKKGINTTKLAFKN